MSVLPLFKLTTRLNSPNPYETEIHNKFWDKNLFINTGIRNWNIWSMDPTKLRFFAYISVLYTITDLQTPETL